VTGFEKDPCLDYTPTVQYSDSKLQLLFTVTPNSQCNVAPNGSPLSDEELQQDSNTLAIAVGVSVGGVVLLAIVFGLLFAFVPALRRIARPYAKRAEDRVQEL